jgi:hypothetical protein
MSITASSTFQRRGAALALAATTAVATGAALLPGAAAQDAGPRSFTLREVQKGSTLTHIRNTRAKSRRSIVQGDQIVFTNPLADSSGRRAGVLHVQCVATVGGRSFLQSTMSCLAIARLHDGDVAVQIIVRPGADKNNGAVTGGTGVYSGARGALTTANSANGATDTFTLL